MHTSILTGHRWLDEVLYGHHDRCRRELGIIHEGINDVDEDDEYDIEGHPFLAGAGNNAIDEEGGFAVDAEEKTRADARWDRIAQAVWADHILDHPDLQ
jgi:hypothetical protein